MDKTNIFYKFLKRYAREANVPIIVAVNKCDKPTAQPEQVLNDLLKYDVIPEQFGGDTQVVNISALNGQGIDHLLVWTFLYNMYIFSIYYWVDPVEIITFCNKF